MPDYSQTMTGGQALGGGAYGQALIAAAGRADAIRDDVIARLAATDQFATVWSGGLHDFQGAASGSLLIACVEPVREDISAPWDAADDGDLEVRGRLHVTLICRADTTDARDALAARLAAIVRNAINGRSLAGLTLPQFTLVSRINWLKPARNQPWQERHVELLLDYRYLEPGWNAADTQE